MNMDRHASTDEKVHCRRLDFADPEDALLLVELLDAYARDPMGGGEALSARTRSSLANVLQGTPNAFSFVAELDGRAVGLANCFSTVSTFAAKPIVNIHDIYVEAACRGAGIGRALLETVEAEARSRDACKLTLEVLTGNERAQAAYRHFGFSGYELDATTGHALFWEKKLAAG